MKRKAKLPEGTHEGINNLSDSMSKIRERLENEMQKKLKEETGKMSKKRSALHKKFLNFKSDVITVIRGLKRGDRIRVVTVHGRNKVVHTEFIGKFTDATLPDCLNMTSPGRGGITVAASCMQELEKL